MKNTVKQLFGVLMVASLLAACNKDENRISVEASTAPVFTATPLMTLGATTNLMQTDSAKPFMKLSWTNPNYRFTTGISSQDVNYVLQIDTTGSNFTNPNKNEVSFSKGTDSTFTIKAFNAILGKLMENMPHNVEMRIKSSIGSAGSLPLYSNVIKMTVTPYLDVAVPIPTGGNLWLTGNALGSGWANPLPTPYVTDQKLKKVSTTLYQADIVFIGGGNYKLLQDNGDWSTQYHMLAGGTWEAGKFEKKDADPGFNGPPSAGTYTVTVDFKTGEFKVVKK